MPERVEAIRDRDGDYAAECPKCGEFTIVRRVGPGGWKIVGRGCWHAAGVSLPLAGEDGGVVVTY